VVVNPPKSANAHLQSDDQILVIAPGTATAA